MATIDYSKEWRRELKRIRRQEERLRAKGFQVKSYKAPKKPKKVTEKSVARLKKQTAAKIYSSSSWTDPLTGKTYKGQAAKKQYTKARKESVSFYETIFRNLYAEMLTAGIDRKTKFDIRAFYQEQANEIIAAYTKGGAGFAYSVMSGDGYEFGNPEKYSERAARAFIENLFEYCENNADSYSEMLAKFNGTYSEENTDINSEYYED